MDINVVCVGGIKSKTEASPCVFLCVSPTGSKCRASTVAAAPLFSPALGLRPTRKFSGHHQILHYSKSFFILHTTLISIPQSAFPRNNYVQPLTHSPYFFLYLSTSYTEKWSCLILSVCFCLLGIFVTYVFTIYMIYFTFILSPFISFFSCSCKLLCFGYSNLL